MPGPVDIALSTLVSGRVHPTSHGGCRRVRMHKISKLLLFSQLWVEVGPRNLVGVANESSKMLWSLVPG